MLVLHGISYNRVGSNKVLLYLDFSKIDYYKYIIVKINT